MYNISNQKITIEIFKNDKLSKYGFDKIANLRNDFTLVNDLCIEKNTISLFNQDCYDYEEVVNNKEDLQQWFNTMLKKEKLNNNIKIEVF